MKNSYSKNQACKLYPGSRVLGKWHRHAYKIVRKLGEGANGTVYLADSAAGLVALKVGIDNMSITLEVNVLKHFQKVRGQVLGPSLLDVDDVVTPAGTYPFYVMDYLKGTELITYLHNRGSEWLAILMVQLLGDLDRLHEAGWVFGDLKPDNTLVVGPPARIRLIDVGGTTLLGRSVKEYTEFFDRGYWGLGSRKAEPSYDLFSVAMIMINCAYPARFEKQGEKPFVFLKKQVEEQPMLRPFRDVILKALHGKYDDAGTMREEMLRAITNIGTKQKKVAQGQVKQKKQTVKKRIKKRERKSSYFIEFFLLASFLLLAYILYLFGKIM